MRAIILAAGMGTRLRPLTDNKPKGLVEVMGMPMVEREIIYLKESGIDEIIIVTGYLKEQFEYLVERYNVKLIHNEKYDIYNNIYTMYLVREYLSDAYVLESDIYMAKNILDKNIEKSMYCGVVEKNFENEWMLRFDENKKVKEIIIGSSTEDIILRGVSYWSKKDGELLSKKIDEVIQYGDFQELYWDNIVKENLEFLDLHVKLLNDGDIFEIDSINDLEKVNSLLMV
ncbi:MAG: sugar phosphate nucleotidyltransferase [Clostridium sp.]|uniref:sugar phosphate nucleotidyltransferase n=1 Tax=Clostridium sp. TaxID=1506 RepID=UPI003F302C51